MNSSIKFCTESDFDVDRDGNLRVNIPKYSLVMFYSTQCPHCEKMGDVFNALNRRIEGCTFAMINLDENKEIIKKCAGSNIDLSYVPMVVFFANTKPIMIYAGPCELDDLERFVIEVSESYKNDNMNNETKHETTDLRGIKDACMLGDEECLKEKSLENGVQQCYVTLAEAYSDNN